MAIAKTTMIDLKTVFGAVVVAIFNTLVGMQSRTALWYALVASVSVYLTVVWRDWFGSAHWVPASTVLVTLAMGTATAGVWRLAVLPMTSEPAFPITVRFDGERAMRSIARPDNPEPLVYVVAHGLTLTNTSTQDVVALLELVVPQPNGRPKIIEAEISDLPPGFVTPEEQQGRVQLRRVVNIPARNAVVGNVGFKLTQRPFDPEGALIVPAMSLHPKSKAEYSRMNPEDMKRELAEGARFAAGTRLRVTNQLDRSYRDFAPELAFADTLTLFLRQ